MLMPLNVLGIKPKGIVHLGACLGEEADMYDTAGVKTVLWVDCNPRTMEYLRLNVSHRPGHRVVEAAVSDKDGEILEFHITNNDASSSILQLKEHEKFYPNIKVDKTVKVTTSTVDALLIQQGFTYDDFDFANLDLQGYELKALQGMTETLKHLQWVYTEVNTKELYAGCCLLPEIDKFLGERGFDRKRLAQTDCEWGDALYEARRFGG